MCVCVWGGWGGVGGGGGGDYSLYAFFVITMWQLQLFSTTDTGPNIHFVKNTKMVIETEHLVDLLFNKLFCEKHNDGDQNKHFSGLVI